MEQAAKPAFLALQSLQHRGQQGCGLAAFGPEGKLRVHKAAGLVRDVLTDEVQEALPGSSCIGHVRYPTTAVGGMENLQPFRFASLAGSFALAHNGNIVNADIVRSRLEEQGHLLHSTSDSELFSHLIGSGLRDKTWVENIISAANQLDGAYSTVILTDSHLYACRDKYGFRPLSIGRLGAGYVIASETCALDAVEAQFIRDVEPGEVISIGPEGLQSFRHSQASGGYMCAMEFIYFARPDSVIEGCNVHAFRKRSGELLWEEHPAPADIVIHVPDSSLSAAMGYAQAGGLPLERGLIKNTYVARTFIQPSQAMRDMGVRMKLSPIRSILEGKRVAVIDDSIVRGTTTRQMVRMLRDAGAKEVHLRIASPKYAWPCFYGIDTGTSEQLIGATHSEKEICAFVGADSLNYLSEQALFSAAAPAGHPARTTLCTACFSARYPTDLYK